MKKLLTKLVIFTFLAIMLSTGLSAFAVDDDDDTTEATNEIEALQERIDNYEVDDQCINKKAKEDPTLIIVILEEPIVDGEINRTTDKDNYFIKRRCFRNTWVDNNHQQGKTSASAMLTSCKPDLYSPSSGDLDKFRFYCQEVTVLISKGGTAIVNNYILLIYQWAATIVGVIAVLVIVLSGIQISASGGDTQVMDNAKNRIIKSLAGIAVLFLSGLILYAINPTFFTR